VVGSGFFGATVAETITSNSDKRVAVIESRNHIGGNSYSEVDEITKIEFHKYGSHLFHTNSKKIWDYCNKFTMFNTYRHKVYTKHAGQIYSMPINLGTINQYFKSSFGPEEAKAKIKEGCEGTYFELSENLESKAISLIGKDLYDAFIKGYTFKQWQTDPRELPASIIKRLPVRYNYNNEYFDDVYQGIPIAGYTKWIENMLDKSTVFLNTDFFDIKNQLDSKQIIVYTGPLDKYFSYQFGELTWRTLDFEMEVKQVNDYQGNSVINYADLDVEYTRIHEFKHLHPERDYPNNLTLIMKEYSRFADKTDEPFYPVNSNLDIERLRKYRNLITKEKNVFFGGRLGTYQYLDMHMAIASALSLCENEILPIIRDSKN
jgi:UDP-galactopyranose mutase